MFEILSNIIDIFIHVSEIVGHLWEKLITKFHRNRQDKK